MIIKGKPRELSSKIYDLDQNKIYEIREYKEKRSNSANAYFHSLINQLARYNRGYGYAISDEEMKYQINLLYGTLATEENGKLIGIRLPKEVDPKTLGIKYPKFIKTDDTDWNCYLVYKETHTLNSKEFYQLIKGLEKECMEVGIKTLSELEFEEMMEKYGK